MKFWFERNRILFCKFVTICLTWARGCAFRAGSFSSIWSWFEKPSFKKSAERNLCTTQWGHYACRSTKSTQHAFDGGQWTLVIFHHLSSFRFIYISIFLMQWMQHAVFSHLRGFIILCFIVLFVNYFWSLCRMSARGWAVITRMILLWTFNVVWRIVHLLYRKASRTVWFRIKQSLKLLKKFQDIQDNWNRTEQIFTRKCTVAVWPKAWNINLQSRSASVATVLTYMFALDTCESVAEIRCIVWSMHI